MKKICLMFIFGALSQTQQLFVCSNFRICMLPRSTRCQVGDQLLEVCGINMRLANYDQVANIIHQCGESISMLVQYNPDSECAFFFFSCLWPWHLTPCGLRFTRPFNPLFRTRASSALFVLNVSTEFTGSDRSLAEESPTRPDSWAQGQGSEGPVAVATSDWRGRQTRDGANGGSESPTPCNSPKSAARQQQTLLAGLQRAGAGGGGGGDRGGGGGGEEDDGGASTSASSTLRAPLSMSEERSRNTTTTTTVEDNDGSNSASSTLTSREIQEALHNFRVHQFQMQAQQHGGGGVGQLQLRNNAALHGHHEQRLR